MRETPRTRRLKSDLRRMSLLQAESSIMTFEAHTSLQGIAEAYLIRFAGRGAWRPIGSPDVITRDQHEVVIRLGANYPRMIPELSWRSPIFHPNISSSGFVCLGGYGTYWAPSLHLDELCIMLWDMVRYKNYDVNSPYNREAALWARGQQGMTFPLDPRSLRDRPNPSLARELAAPRPVAPEPPEIVFLDDAVDAEVVVAEENTPEREVLIIQ